MSNQSRMQRDKDRSIIFKSIKNIAANLISLKHKMRPLHSVDFSTLYNGPCNKSHNMTNLVNLVNLVTKLLLSYFIWNLLFCQQVQHGQYMHGWPGPSRLSQVVNNHKPPPPVSVCITLLLLLLLTYHKLIYMAYMAMLKYNPMVSLNEYAKLGVYRIVE